MDLQIAERRFGLEPLAIFNLALCASEPHEPVWYGRVHNDGSRQYEGSGSLRYRIVA